MTNIGLFMDSFVCCPSDIHIDGFIENKYFYFFAEYKFGLTEILNDYLSKVKPSDVIKDKYYCGLSRDLEFIDIAVSENDDVYKTLLKSYTLNKINPQDEPPPYDSIKNKNKCIIL
jgi:hypothetical protein